MLSYRHYGENGKKSLCFQLLFAHALDRGGICTFMLKIVNTLIKNRYATIGLRCSKTGHATISLRSRHKNQPTANPLRVGQGQ